MRRSSLVNSEVVFIVKLFLAWMTASSIFRLGLLLRNSDLADGIPVVILMQSFLVGARFDAVITCYLLLPLILWSLLPKYGWQYSDRAIRVLPWGIALLWVPLIFVCLAEWEFYRDFHERFNQLALQYLLDDHATVLSMIWNGYPVIRYLLLWLALSGAAVYVVGRFARKLSTRDSFSWKTYFRKVIPAGLLLLAFTVVGARGGLQTGAPLRWGDAYFSSYTFANHLALSGVFTLSRAALEMRHHDRARFWRKRLAVNDAREITRHLVVQNGDRLISEDNYPLLRSPGNSGRTVTFDRPPRHVVLIMMESFAGECTGALGAPYGATPNLDRLAQKGILFDRFFSQGTHTHQGLFATICSFPNLPGFEYLMKNNHGQQPFRSFISLLNAEGFESLYVYNGSFTWDNQEGFFRNQGMKHFVGRDDYIKPKFMDATWGVSDEDMFMRSLEVIRKLTAQGPTFAFLQTVSNHAPFDLPPPAPFTDLTGPDTLMPRLNGMRYSDWALGLFFDHAEKESWFADTLFVILGDHGFSLEAPQAMINLSNYHVPLLFYYPRHKEGAGIKVHSVGSQVDVLPTVLGLMNITSAHQSWGRDLFRLDPDDKGWAVIKPSGGGQTVGLIRDDMLYVTSPGVASSLYQFSLNPWTVTQTRFSGDISEMLSRELHAYVQTGLDTLLSFRAGVSAEQLYGARK